MEREELYIEFVDGTIDSDSELEFANKFATDESFRRGFKTYLKLINTINKNVKTYGPTIAETNQIYAKLGYTAPVFLTSSSPITTKESKYWTFTKYFTTVILSSIITILLFQNYHNGNIPNSKSTLSQKTDAEIYREENSQLIKQSQNEGSLSKSGVNNIVDNENDKNHSTDIVGKENPPNKNEIIQNDPINRLNNKAEKLESLEIFSTTDLTTNNKLLHEPNDPNSNYDNYKNHYLDAITNVMFDISTVPKNYLFENNLIIEFKNSPTFLFNTPRVNPDYLSQYNNVDLSILYQLSKTMSMGLNLRQETFYLQYKGIDSEGYKYQAYQQPNLTSYGIFGRYKPLIIAEYFEPIIQFTLSMNNHGIISRELIGLEYYPIDNFYFIIGAEFNQMFFQHQQTLFTANKININYGIGVKL